ncbi:peptidoglycan DD-metalloendopeptidase family protein [Vibrio sp. E150_011]
MLLKRPVFLSILIVVVIAAIYLVKVSYFSTAQPLADTTIKVTPYANTVVSEPQRAPLRVQRIHYVIQEGDSLSLIFDKFSLPQATLSKLLAADVSDLKLDNLTPKARLELVVDATDQHLIQLIYHHSLAERAVYVLNKEGEFDYKYVEEAGEWHSQMYAGEITGSFSVAANSHGLTSRQIATISRVLSDKINFSRDLRKGDRFEVLVNEQYLGNRLTGKTEIQGIRFNLSNGPISAFLAEDGRFYDRDGNSLEQAFNRYPIAKEYRRITSPFNPHRKHPVTGRVTPHNGTDFATPVGTPIYSTGDGQVVAIKNHPYAGKYLVIEHNSVYTTRYLHLSKFLVRVGEKVKRGQKVALSGATGRLTGPHLHFEVLVRNRPVDAMKANLPLAQAISKDEKPAFSALVAMFDEKSVQYWEKTHDASGITHVS